MSAEYTNGGPAFPRLIAITNTGHAKSTDGMSFRDAAALAALPAIIEKEWGNHVGASTDEGCARLAYRMADAMLKARER